LEASNFELNEAVFSICLGDWGKPPSGLATSRPRCEPAISRTPFDSSLREICKNGNLLSINFFFPANHSLFQWQSTPAQFVVYSILFARL